LAIGSPSRLTESCRKKTDRIDDVTRMKYPAERAYRESSKAIGPKNADLIANRRLASTGYGVVRTLTSLAVRLDAWRRSEILDPDGFPSMGVPTYPGCAWRCRTGARLRPEGFGIARPFTSRRRPIGWAARAYAGGGSLAFTTSYTTRFRIYCGTLDHSGGVELCGASALSRRRCDHHDRTASLRQKLHRARFRRLGTWTRGVDTSLHAHDPVELDCPDLSS